MAYYMPSIGSKYNVHRKSKLNISRISTLEKDTDYATTFSDWSSPSSPPLGSLQKTTLILFVIDESMPGANNRIDALKGAVENILPRGKVAIISCYENDAEVVVHPTNSLLSATHSLKKLHKSIMGNLSIGMSLALNMIDEVFTKQSGLTKLSHDYCENILLVVMADSKAHGLLSHLDDTCDVESVRQCDDATLQIANDLADKSTRYKANKLLLKTIIVDTEVKLSGAKFTEEGLKLATASNGMYVHAPDITSEKLLKLISEVDMTM